MTGAGRGGRLRVLRPLLRESQSRTMFLEAGAAGGGGEWEWGSGLQVQALLGGASGRIGLAGWQHPCALLGGAARGLGPLPRPAERSRKRLPCESRAGPALRRSPGGPTPRVRCPERPPSSGSRPPVGRGARRVDGTNQRQSAGCGGKPRGRAAQAARMASRRPARRSAPAGAKGGPSRQLRRAGAAGSTKRRDCESSLASWGRFRAGERPGSPLPPSLPPTDSQRGRRLGRCAGL